MVKPEIHAHRGFRGHYPENTITSFIEAARIGADAIEMDVVISKDSQVVVSHEPWMNPLFCTRPDGHPVEVGSKEKYNLFEMNYAEIAAFDCGSRTHPEFPFQRSIPERKPLLSDVIAQVDDFTRKNKLPLIKYTIEIKSDPHDDEIFQPDPVTFVELVYGVLNSFSIYDRVMLQSFDVRILQQIRKKDPGMLISLLVENMEGLEKNLERLDFIPGCYGPEFVLVDDELAHELKRRKVKLIPWTVNEVSDMKRLIGLGVDGIITDYPDRALKLFT